MDTIAFPIKFKNNELVKLEQGTDKYFNQLIAATLQIAPGELVLEAGFGIRNMAFEKPSIEDIKQLLTVYFPELYIDSVNLFQNQNTEEYFVSVSYSQ